MLLTHLSLPKADCDGVGVLRMLDAVRAAGLEQEIRFYQASTSELYGKVREVPQSETTPFYPRSPYAGESFMNVLQCVIVLIYILSISQYPRLILYCMIQSPNSMPFGFW